MYSAEKLASDWLGRSSETYLDIRKSLKLDWESLMEDSSYSSFSLKAIDKIFKTTSDKDRFKAMYKGLVKGRQILMVMDLPYKPYLTLNYEEDSSYCGGRKIVCSSFPFKDKALEGYAAYDVFFGLVVHEGAHVKYTDSEIWTSEVLERAIVRDISNILEDERIEYNIGQDIPGFARFLEKTRSYYFSKSLKSSKKAKLKELTEGDLDDLIEEEESLEEGVTREEMASRLTDIQKVMDIFIRAIRYPATITEKEVEPYAEVLSYIRDTVVPFPETTSECIEAAKRIVTILSEFFDIPEDSFDKLESVKEVVGAAGSFTSSSATSGGPEEAPSGGDDDDYSESSSDKDKVIKDIMDDTIDYFIDGDVYFIKEENDKDTYLRVASKIKKQAGVMNKLFSMKHRDEALVLNSMRTGLLDSSKLVEARMGIPTVYKRFGKIETDKVCVCLLIDESGSMYGSKIAKALETAVLFNESLKQSPDTELYVYGHSADQIHSGATEVYVYKEKGYSKEYAIGSCRARRENRDGAAILHVAKRVRHFTEKPCIMFVIADGSPAAHHYHDGVSHTRSCVSLVEKMGFTVINIAIEAHMNPSSMFTNWIKMTNINKLPSELGTFMRGVLNRVQKNRVTYF